MADLISPQVASSLLEHSLWLPTLVAGLHLVASYPILALMDEPLQAESMADGGKSKGSKPLSMGDTFKHLLTNWKVVLCMSITFLLQFRYMNQSVLIAYASVRFKWSIAQVEYIEVPLIHQLTRLKGFSVTFYRSRSQLSSVSSFTYHAQNP